MGYILNRRCREKGGYRIEGKGITLDILVKRVEGTKGTREAIIEFKGELELPNLHLKKSDGQVKILYGLYLTINPYEKTSGKKIPLEIDAEGYKVTRIYADIVRK
jgi:hypothetical protein